MKKETILSYLEQQLEKQLTDYDFALDWDRKNHTIEIIIRLFAENKKEVGIEDSVGIFSEEEIIEFEDGILFYQKGKSSFCSEDYLVTFPMEGKKGLAKILLDTCVDYLVDVLHEGASELLEFIQDDQIEVFELNWDMELFEQRLEKRKEKEKEEYIAYPSY